MKRRRRDRGDNKLSGLRDSLADRVRATDQIQIHPKAKKAIERLARKHDWDLGGWVYDNIQATLAIGLMTNWTAKQPGVFRMRHEFLNPFPHALEVECRVGFQYQFYVEVINVWKRKKA